MTVGIENSSFVDARLARTTRRFLLPQSDINMRVPDTVRKCVLTLGCEDECTREIVYGGTAFVVTIPGRSREWNAPYLVTAKHSLQKIGDRRTIFRANSKSGEAVEIDATGAKWFFHPDPVVDLAIIPFLPSLELDLDVRSVSESMFLTAEDIAKHRIGPGDEVFMTGLFTKVKGHSKNLPIVRMGTVALIPDEQIPFDDNLIDAYLVEARSIGGLSGSPAFVSETVQMAYPSKLGKKYPEEADIYFVPGKTFFMGLVIGHWDVPPSLSLLEKEKVNMGISVVVPCWKIRELLYLPEHVKMRKEAEKLAMDEEGISSADFVAPEKKEKPFTRSDFEAALKKVSRKKDK